MRPRCGAWIFPAGNLILILRRTQMLWEAAESRSGKSRLAERRIAKGRLAKNRQKPVSDLASYLRPLHVAEVHGLEQGREWVARGDEFVGNVAFVSGAYDAAHDAIPLDFLSVVEFVPAGNSAGVVVAEPLAVLLNGTDEIAFHYLHVVDVIEQFHVGRIHFL